MSTPTQQIDTATLPAPAPSTPSGRGERQLRHLRSALPDPELAAALRAAATGPELVAALDAVVRATDLATASAEELAALWVAAVRTTLWSEHLQQAIRAEVDARLRRHALGTGDGEPGAADVTDHVLWPEDTHPWDDDLEVDRDDGRDDERLGDARRDDERLDDERLDGHVPCACCR